MANNGSWLLQLRLMEQMRAGTAVTLILLLGVVSGQDYFAGLNIDPTLISQTNIAITTLKNSLYLNFNCNPQQFAPIIPAATSTSNSNSPLPPFAQGYQNSQFQGMAGGDYNGAPPAITCQNGRQRSAILFSLYQQVLTVTTLLQTIKSYLVQYNNVVLGSNNTVIGCHNFILGSNNDLVGNNDWVFASDYESTDPQNGVLVIELYLIELASVSMIAYNPSLAIHCVDQAESNRQFNNFWKQAPDQRRFAF